MEILRKHQAIIDSLIEGIIIIDRKGRIISFNRAAERIIGVSRDQALGKKCWEVIKGPHSKEEGCCLNVCLEKGQTLVDKTIYIKRGDSAVPVSLNASPIYNKDQIVGISMSLRDLTDSLQMNLILESIADGVFTVGRDFRITSFNRAAEKITGWHRQEAIGQYCWNIFHSSICGDKCAIAQAIRTGKPVMNQAIYVRRRDGRSIPVSISAAPLTDDEGNIIGAVETFRDLTEIIQLRSQLRKSFSFQNIVSKSPAMQKIFDVLPDIAQSGSNVLITGESGTGKELIALAIHNLSKYKDGPFVAINCGALPDTLLESELFGYKAGAFTDAKRDKKGKIAAAEGGTLFLDEIGEVSPAFQAKLLRFLETKTYEPLGSTETKRANVRIVAATNKDLAQMVHEGRFREDLYYRLNVATVKLPPLRERKEDIPLLIDHFIEKFNAEKGKNITGISEEALEILMRYDFPGNIRELENIIEYSFILCRGGVILPEHLPESLLTLRQKKDEHRPCLVDEDSPLTLEEIEKRAIYQALKRNNWRRMATCRELGISKDTLRRKIAKYQLDIPSDEAA
ncbi:PAS domain S-box protein [Thermosulfuriphilus ammonigenes]|uniref:PAS domain S-box protein n=1 Tax=Thermosulfuriphilus ammonigenes TaxID=1936021 RepID=A0A6G7PXS9_9BACT|nr:sigma 54-interacting transcriptional regulator [Thermosulfuriphilus ammonigenes]MBA2849692.1 PAS domain S-box-containing protein [Thermosulfuriphilus ammonigenes]QIJ72213.1 PAS domain S-box protein [Thermosulfuriphilus ammonigenes]